MDDRRGTIEILLNRIAGGVSSSGADQAEAAAPFEAGCFQSAACGEFRERASNSRRHGGRIPAMRKWRGGSNLCRAIRGRTRRRSSACCVGAGEGGVNLAAHVLYSGSSLPLLRLPRANSVRKAVARRGDANAHRAASMASVRKAAIALSRRNIGQPPQQWSAAIDAM